MSDERQTRAAQKKGVVKLTSPNYLKIAERVLLAINGGELPRHKDAFELRMRVSGKERMHPLRQLAEEVIDGAIPSATQI